MAIRRCDRPGAESTNIDMLCFSEMGMSDSREQVWDVLISLPPRSRNQNCFSILLDLS